MKILLLGANGQVGHELARSLRPLGNVVATTRSGVLNGEACEIADFDRPDSLPSLVDRVSPDIVVNAAAYTAVDRAESEPEAAFRANAEAPGKLAKACVENDILLVHYSTDYVFDGQGTRPYREDDPTSPLGVYGASKLAGEQAIEASGCRRFIFRTAWVYGNHGANFMRTMLRLGAEREELRIVADQVGMKRRRDTAAVGVFQHARGPGAGRPAAARPVVDRRRRFWRWDRPTGADAGSSSSQRPRRTVSAATPTAAATIPAPPGPSSRASAPSHNRR
jgi:dTDP-4-dehydrorhamnose reductase